MDLYSRLVAIFKVLLPTAALAILATLFLLSRGIDMEATIPFAEAEIEERLREQQVTGPFFTGTTPKGDEIIVEATLARPGGANRPAEAKDVSARMKTAKGALMTLNAALVSVRPGSDVAVFTGDVHITTSSGLDVRTDELRTALSGISGNTPGTVNGTSPFGEISAGKMRFEAKNGDGPLHVLFNGGVKLIYTPKTTE